MTAAPDRGTGAVPLTVPGADGFGGGDEAALCGVSCDFEHDTTTIAALTTIPTRRSLP